MTEKSNRVEYEMKYIGWNIGATRVEQHDTMGGIEILELKIDGVDVLKQLEAVRTHLTKWVSKHSDWQMGRMSQWKKELDAILEAED